MIEARVRAAPEEAANPAHVALVAEALGRPKSAVTLAAGATSRLKSVRVEGDPAAPEAAVRALFA